MNLEKPKRPTFWNGGSRYYAVVKGDPCTAVCTYMDACLLELVAYLFSFSKKIKLG